MISRLTSVNFSAKLKDGKTIRVQAAQMKGEVLLALYFITIDFAEPVLFDIRKCVENKTALAKQLSDTKDQALREAIVRETLAQVNTEFILKNKQIEVTS